MQNLTSLKEIENAVDQYGEIVVSKNQNNNVIIMSMEEYKKKMMENQMEKKLKKAEKQIEEGKTVSADLVFRELEEKYGF